MNLVLTFLAILTVICYHIAFILIFVNCGHDANCYTLSTVMYFFIFYFSLMIIGESCSYENDENFQENDSPQVDAV